MLGPCAEPGGGSMRPILQRKQLSGLIITQCVRALSCIKARRTCQLPHAQPVSALQRKAAPHGGPCRNSTRLVTKQHNTISVRSIKSGAEEDEIHRYCSSPQTKGCDCKTPIQLEGRGCKEQRRDNGKNTALTECGYRSRVSKVDCIRNMIAWQAMR